MSFWTPRHSEDREHCILVFVGSCYLLCSFNIRTLNRVIKRANSSFTMKSTLDFLDGVAQISYRALLSHYCSSHHIIYFPGQMMVVFNKEVLSLLLRRIFYFFHQALLLAFNTIVSSKPVDRIEDK